MPPSIARLPPPLLICPPSYHSMVPRLRPHPFFPPHILTLGAPLPRPSLAKAMQQLPAWGSGSLAVLLQRFCGLRHCPCAHFPPLG